MPYCNMTKTKLKSALLILHVTAKMTFYLGHFIFIMSTHQPERLLMFMYITIHSLEKKKINVEYLH